MFLLPCAIFAQDKTTNQEVLTAKNSATSDTKVGKKVAYFLDGKQIDYKTFLMIDVETIDKVEKIKNDPKFPDGRINVTLKK